MIQQWHVEVSIRAKENIAMHLKDMPVRQLMDVSNELEDLFPGRRNDSGIGFGARDIDWRGLSEKEAQQFVDKIKEFAQQHPAFSFEINVGAYEEDVME